MYRIAVAGAVGALLLGVSVGTSAQQKPEDAIHYRQSALFIVGQNFGPLAAMVQGKIPYDREDAVRRAGIVAFVARLPWNSFGPGTEHGGNTKAKPEIWENLDDFKSKAQDMMAEAAKLPEAAGDLSTLRTQVGATGKACKACHDKYRNK
ncbi:MAG: cytochrome c [Betaproteobacteria bacterium]|nr:cytochrome c [Betaproteobacteria bacterium]